MDKNVGAKAGRKKENVQHFLQDKDVRDKDARDKDVQDESEGVVLWIIIKQNQGEGR